MFVFHFWLGGGGGEQQNKGHQYDQRQTRSPKAGGEIDGPYCRADHHRGNPEEARHERLVVILLGTGDSAAVAANYFMGAMTLTQLSRGWKKMGAVGSDP